MYILQETFNALDLNRDYSSHIRLQVKHSWSVLVNNLDPVKAAE